MPGVESNAPTPIIESLNREHLTTLPFGDTADFDDADRGFIAALEPCVITAADGRVVWDNDVYAFLGGDAPASVHPSLWRQSHLVAKQGLYEVVAGIYQVRGLDLSTSLSSRATPESSSSTRWCAPKPPRPPSRSTESTAATGRYGR